MTVFRRSLCSARFTRLSSLWTRHSDPIRGFSGCRSAPSTLRALLDLRPPARREAYGDHPQQRAELHLSDGPGPYPVVVGLHGGFWRARRSLRYMRPACADLARHGWAAWNVEYRRVGRSEGGGWPATFADVAAAIDHLADLDAPLDLTRVAAMGHSAGGQLALWAAARPHLPEGVPGANPGVAITAGVAALAAPSDLEATPDLYGPGGAVFDLMGCAPFPWRAPVAAEETTEMFAFMEGADESKRQGGGPVALADVMAKAKILDK